MYSYITGKVVDVSNDKIVIENNGIGFEIGASLNTLSSVHVGEIRKIYTYLHVREDQMSLYGFVKLQEKQLFLSLIEISGIGPKIAMQILSGCEFNTLTLAIATGDVNTLKKIKGLGKKTAELIIVHLKDSISSSISSTDVSTPLNGVLSDEVNQAVDVLCTLGVDRVDAIKQVTELSKTVSGTENLISAALKQRG